jgi:hypothetical protein
MSQPGPPQIGPLPERRLPSRRPRARFHRSPPGFELQDDFGQRVLRAFGVSAPQSMSFKCRHVSRLQADKRTSEASPSTRKTMEARCQRGLNPARNFAFVAGPFLE